MHEIESMNTQPQGLLLRGGEVAKVLGVSRAMAYRLMQRGELPVVRIGSCVRVPAEALRAWIDARTEACLEVTR
jgi:excisionase family DNA binding protein